MSLRDSSRQPQTLLIAGVSVRAAAQSALRAGLQPLAVDCFADVDLQACCPTRRADHYPDGLVNAARHHPPSPWMYTGALENHPAIIRAISQHRRLLGNPSEVVQAVRDPWQLSLCLADHGLAFPPIVRATEPLPPGEWICKPYRSGGGLQLHRLRTAYATPRSCPPTHFWQRWQPGESISAVYLAAARNAMLLGVTRQLSGTPWTGAMEFQYAGSIAPLPVSPAENDCLTRIGRALARSFNLAGLFGVDLIRDNQQLWPLEVNPRYTASVEVVEFALQTNLIAWHVAACLGQALPSGTSPQSHRTMGKAIVYACETTSITPEFSQWVRDQNLRQPIPAVADIPAVGSVFAPRQPICTVLASGSSPAEVEERLRQHVTGARAALSVAASQDTRN